MKTAIIRYAIVMALFAFTGYYVYGHRKAEIVVPHTPMAKFPVQLGSWSGRDEIIPDDVLELLGPGDFLSRLYVKDASTPPVDLFIGYFPSQKLGDTVHSPKFCLPGAGWTFEQSESFKLPMPGQPPLDISRHIISKGDVKQLVLYWYQSHGRTASNEYVAKIHLVTDSIRMDRSDGAIVRVITPIYGGESPNSAEARAVAFAQQIVPHLNSYIPE